MKNALVWSWIGPLFLISLMLSTCTLGALAQDLEPDTYEMGRVVSVETIQDSLPDEIQRITVQVTEGADKGMTFQEDRPVLNADLNGLGFSEGDRIVVLKNTESTGFQLYIADRYRLPSLWFLLLLFLGLIVLLTGLRGISSMLGLGFSLLVILFFILPRILDGADPLLTSFFGGIVISTVSLYFAHGFNKRTTIALVGMVLTIGLALGLSVLFVEWTRLTGGGSEDAYFLQLGDHSHIDLRGLLLGGIMIGVLGILDDVTTAQAAAVEELSKANSRLTLADLYQRGLSIGKEHITSLVNTLVMAYAGASLPVLILLMVMEQPFWVTLNSELLMEELVRTLVGSIALILAVPITTWIAAWSFSRRAT